MSYLFLALALLAFIGFAWQSFARNGHGMIYAAVMVAIWLTAALWWAGRLA